LISPFATNCFSKGQLFFTKMEREVLFVLLIGGLLYSKCRVFSLQEIHIMIRQTHLSRNINE
jgi:hypothetical protein